ncbi:MAG: deaminase [Nitrosopumilus sp.]
MHWSEYFIKMAELVAQKSKDPRTKVGNIIVGPDHEIRTTGFNGFPRGVREYSLVECTKCNATGSRRGPSMEVLGDEGFCNACSGYGKIVSYDLIDQDRWASPAKYEYVCHAEANAVYNAARMGTALEGCTAYFNYEPYPCAPCAMALIQSGVREWVGPAREFPSSPERTFVCGGEEYLKSVAHQMAAEAGVNILRLPYEGD